MTDAMNGEGSLDVERMLQQARKRTGLDDFGPPVFLEPLQVLVDALKREANLNPAGLIGQEMRLVEILVSRLKVEEWFRQYPEIESEQIVKPVVIVGLPRTGTTMLHRIMASDSRFYAPMWYEVRFPAPDPGWDFTGQDPRIPVAKAEVQAMIEGNPDLAAIHPMDAMAADEELMLLEQSFFSTTPEAFANIPSYGQWLSGHDNRPGYRYLVRLLKFLQWQKRQLGQEAGRWVLKTPHHLHYMALLLETFPDAMVIQTHRDPLETIPSICSFHYALWKLAADNPDPSLVAQQWSQKFAAGMSHTMAVREQFPDRFLDVDYRDTIERPLEVVESIYHFAGLPLTEDARHDIEAHCEANRRESRAPHNYDAATFGLTPEGIKGLFAEYRKKYIEKQSGD